MYNTLLKLLPKQQWAVMRSNRELNDEIENMVETACNMPKLGATENMDRHPLGLHYFSSACDWYICEWDGEDRFFGYTILNNDFEMSEWGYISRSELLSLEAVLLKRGDSLNLCSYGVSYKTIEDALYARNPEYFYKYRRNDE